MTEEERAALKFARASLEKAVDALTSAAIREDLPTPLRSAVVGALVAAARIEGMFEWLDEGLAQLG